ncbi:hypothetical protein SAMN04487944_13213 [Gracilibacillus ureilyticus]|uniref:Uncharacterized protein n=1 Tax=Gracilibacillus ureilyticus TaxID=531814 RepID=A0A1H9W1G4_9BACI|nr:hypothetical protein [Gracilibacillus ureilyticus]SES27725.1 hypothetical protein SAMN04487944_13213 [Gracilibacillus ureilyticus]
MDLLADNKRYALASLITAIVIGFIDWYVTGNIYDREYFLLLSL